MLGTIDCDELPDHLIWSCMRGHNALTTKCSVLFVSIFLFFLLLESTHSAKGPDQPNDEIKEVGEAKSMGMCDEVMEMFPKESRNSDVIVILENFVNDKKNQNLKRKDIANWLKKTFDMPFGTALKIAPHLIEMIGRVNEFKGLFTSDKCSICTHIMNPETETLEEMEKCKHTFHKNCIFSWFAISQSCPMCPANGADASKTDDEDEEKYLEIREPRVLLTHDRVTETEYLTTGFIRETSKDLYY
eukprot:316085_1